MGLLYPWMAFEKRRATSVKVVYRLDSVIGHATSCVTNACSSFALSFEIRGAVA